MKKGDLVITIEVLPSSSSHKIGMVLSSQQMRPTDTRQNTNIITVMFPETNLVHCFPEHYLKLISET